MIIIKSTHLIYLNTINSNIAIITLGGFRLVNHAMRCHYGVRVVETVVGWRWGHHHLMVWGVHQWVGRKVETGITGRHLKRQVIVSVGREGVLFVRQQFVGTIGFEEPVADLGLRAVRDLDRRRGRAAKVIVRYRRLHG